MTNHRPTIDRNKYVEFSQIFHINDVKFKMKMYHSLTTTIAIKSIIEQTVFLFLCVALSRSR